MQQVAHAAISLGSRDMIAEMMPGGKWWVRARGCFPIHAL